MRPFDSWEEAKRRAESLQCSFCGKPSAEVRKLIAGPKVFICDGCVAAGHELQDVASPDDKGLRNLCCSFCGKPRHEVRKLVFGPTVYVCDECLGLCDDILAEEFSRDSRKPTS